MTKDEALKIALDYVLRTTHWTEGRDRHDTLKAIKEALAQEQKPMHPELRKMWEDYFDKCFRAMPLPEPVAQPAQEPMTYPFEDASVISALSWAASLIRKEYPAGHNGADSWLMNYADEQGERIRLADHREWEKVHGRWEPKTTPPKAAQEPIGEVRNSSAYFYNGRYTDKTDAPDGTKLYTTPPKREWVGLMRGVRVEGDTVIISVKGGNDAARELCGALVKEMEEPTTSG